MKSLFCFLAVLLSAHYLLAQTSLLGNDTVPISHLPSSISYLAIPPKFMMDPAEVKNMKEGVECLKEVLRSPEKIAIPSKTPIATTSVIYSPVGSVFYSSSNASPVVSDQRVIEAIAVSTGDETMGGNSTAQFLEQEICDNIYLGCLAKVATMPQAERVRIEGVFGISQESKEWAAAEHKAKRDVEKSQQVLEAATEEKKIADKELKMMLDDASSVYGRDNIAKAYDDFDIKKLAEKLAATRVETARATFYAIQVKNTEQSASAETDLTKAIEEEKKALNVLETKKLETEQNLASLSIPIAEAVAIYPSDHFHEAYTPSQHFSFLNLSPERGVQEEQKVSAKKEKAAAAFETEFSMMIETSKVQAEEAAEAATTAREKAEKQGASEKTWNDALEEAEITGEAYSHLVGLYEMYKEQAAEHYEGGMLKTKCSKYNFELKKAEKKKVHWATEVEECRQKKATF